MGDTLSSGWPVFFITTLFVLHIGPMQTLFAYRLADPEIKQHTSWFVGYLFFSTLFYTEYKNTIARVSHIKEWMGERSWRVTPRTNDPTDVLVLDDDLTSGYAADAEGVSAPGREPEGHGHVVESTRLDRSIRGLGQSGVGRDLLPSGQRRPTLEAPRLDGRLVTPHLRHAAGGPDDAATLPRRTPGAHFAGPVDGSEQERILTEIGAGTTVADIHSAR